MIDIGEKDWELLNAFCDRELNQAEMQHMQARLDAEPALAQALENIRTVSHGLAALRPGVLPAAFENTGLQPGDPHSRLWWCGGLVAAALAVVMIVGPAFFSEPTAMNIHVRLANQPASPADGAPRNAASYPEQLPDLSRANLIPIVAKSTKTGQIAHYAGRNGCRLSYLRGGFDLGAKRDDNQQIATWTTPDGLHHMVIATGMNQNRFDAIATYLKLVTRQQPTRSLMAATNLGSTADAPCTG